MVIGAEVREGCEVALVRGSGALLSLPAQPERHCLEETVFGGGGEDGVVISGCVSIAVSLEETEHLVAVHSGSFLDPVDDGANYAYTELRGRFDDS